MVGAQTLAVALADLGQDVDPVPSFNTVVGLDVQRSLWLDHLEHLMGGRGVEDEVRWSKNISCSYPLLLAFRLCHTMVLRKHYESGIYKPT